MRIVVDCHGHHLISNMLLLQLVWLLCCYGLHFVEQVLYWQQMYRAMQWGRLFLMEKYYGTYSTVFPMSFLSFFLKTKSSVSPTNFTDVLLIGSNVMWNCLCFMTKQMDRHMSIVIVDVFVDIGIVSGIIIFILYWCSFLVNVIWVWVGSIDQYKRKLQEVSFLCS